MQIVFLEDNLHEMTKCQILFSGKYKKISYRLLN